MGSLIRIQLSPPENTLALQVCFFIKLRSYGETKPDMIKRLLKLLKGYYVQSVLAPTFKMLEALFELMVPLAVAAIIDKGINAEPADKSTVFAMCGVMIALGIIGLICAICAQYFAARAAVGVATRARSALFAHIQKFSYKMTDKLGISTLITRMTGDINSMQTGVNMFLRLFMRSPFIVFGAMIMAFTIEKKLSLIFLVTIVVLMIVVFGIMLISIPIYKRSQARLDKVVSKIRENYNGTRVVRAFNKEESEAEEFDRRNSLLTKIQLFAGRISALMNPLTYVLINVGIIVLIYMGADFVDHGEISQGELLALYNYMSQILVELIKLASLTITLTKAWASAKRVFAVLDTPPVESRKAEAEIGDDKSAICFEKVSFKYHENGDEALSAISFSAKRGETVGIIGGTGSGKTTLVNLIPTFYAPTTGSIFINGKNAFLYSKEELNELFAVVPQKAALFKGTVRSNLLWGRSDASDEELWRALELAQAKDFVEALPDGLDSAVEQNGGNFSGGQKQRLTIARALVKNSQFLILDDSASALDYATESRLRASLSTLGDSTTVFIISQRTSSIMHADKIIVLDDGDVVGMGKHEELLESCEIYKEIYNSQFSEGGEAK